MSATKSIYVAFILLTCSEVSPLALNAETFSKVVTVLDASLASSSSTFAIHALAPDKTVFLSGSGIASYLQTLESEGQKIHVVDFETLKAEAAAAPAAVAPSRPSPEKVAKEDAKIDGAVQIAIGVKKEVDFASWYTNVRRSDS